MIPQTWALNQSTSKVGESQAPMDEVKTIEDKYKIMYIWKESIDVPQTTVSISILPTLIALRGLGAIFHGGREGLHCSLMWELWSAPHEGGRLMTRDISY